MKKIIAILIVLAGSGILGWQIYVRIFANIKGTKDQRDHVPVAVEISPVVKTSIREIGNFTGSLYPLSEFMVAPKIAGRLEKIMVNIGDVVKSDQLIAELDDEEYRQQVSQAIAELEVSQANQQEYRNTLENAKREYERTAALREKKIASESQLDASESEYKTQQAKLRVAIAQVSQKKAALEMAKVRLSYAQIRVPQNHITGYRVVGERFVDEGAMLAPNTAIVSIIDIGRMVAVINVIERDYPKIQPGLAAVITTDAFPGQTFSGKVVRIAPLLKEKSREARVEIEIPNEEGLLKPGMFARVQMEFKQHDNATVVPVAALVKRNGTQGIFVVEAQKRARFIPVSLGIVSGTQAEILSPPLSPQSTAVITLGHHLLEDGSWVILPDETAKADSKGAKKADSGGPP